jgi:hypothetical protein
VPMRSTAQALTRGLVRCTTPPRRSVVATGTLLDVIDVRIGSGGGHLRNRDPERGARGRRSPGWR